MRLSACASSPPPQSPSARSPPPNPESPSPFISWRCRRSHLPSPCPSSGRHPPPHNSCCLRASASRAVLYRIQSTFRHETPPSPPSSPSTLPHFSGGARQYLNIWG